MQQHCRPTAVGVCAEEREATRFAANLGDLFQTATSIPSAVSIGIPILSRQTATRQCAERAIEGLDAETLDREASAPVPL